MIHRKCKSCRLSTLVDPKLKMSSYIVKNPPKKEIDFSLVRDRGRSASRARGLTPASRFPTQDQEDSSSDDDAASASSSLPKNGGLKSAKPVVDPDLALPAEQRLEKLKKFVDNALKTGTIGDGKVYFIFF